MSDETGSYYFEAEIDLTRREIDKAGSVREAIYRRVRASAVPIVVLEVEGEDF